MSSSRIAVVSGAYYSDPNEYKHLTRSAELLGVPLTLIGVGQPYPEFGLVIDIRNHLRTRTEEYALVTDAGDAMFVQWDEQMIIDRVNVEPSGLLVSTEKDCWPAGPWCDVYNGGRGINGGQYCGKRLAVIDMLERLDGFTDEHGGTWQERMHKLYASGYALGLDKSSLIFLTMNQMRLEDIQSRPQLFHFNGRTPGIETYFAALWAREA